jgi:ABC-type transport system involved in multi-copper enzyme maturation permease subunit
VWSIIQRELIGLLRQRRAVAVQIGIAAAFTLLIALRWPTEPRMALSGTRSQEMFRLLSYGMLGSVMLLLPMFPATSLVREKSQGTLALLFNTPLGAGRIFFGKLLAVLGVAAVIVAVTIPASSACFALGGVSFRGDLLSSYGIVALTALQYAALGLLVSSYAGSTDAAVRVTYGCVLLLSVASLVLHYFLIASEGVLGEIVEWLRCASPLAAMMAALGAGDVGARGIATTVNVAGRFTLMSLAITGICSVWTISRLGSAMFDKARAAGTMVDDQALLVRISRRLLFIVDPRRRSRAIGRLTNPVMVKEFRCRKFGRLHWLLRLVAGSAVLSLALAILSTTRTTEWDVPTIGAILVLLQVTLIVLITPSLTGGLISTERESAGWVLLQSTPLSVWSIVCGKLLSVFLTLLLVMCATLPGYLVMVYIDPGQRFQVQRVVICLALTAVFSMFASAAVGSFFSRTATAVAAAYTLLLVICGAPLLVWLGRDAPFGHDTVEAALRVNPVAAALTVIRVSGFRDYELLPVNWWILGAGSVCSLLVLLWQTRRLSQPR